MDKTKPTLLGRKELPEVQKKTAFNYVSGDLHPRDHVLPQIEIFTYNFFEVFCREGDEFYANIMM